GPALPCPGGAPSKVHPPPYSRRAAAPRGGAAGTGTANRGPPRSLMWVFHPPRSPGLSPGWRPAAVTATLRRRCTAGGRGSAAGPVGWNPIDDLVDAAGGHRLAHRLGGADHADDDRDH